MDPARGEAPTWNMLSQMETGMWQLPCVITLLTVTLLLQLTILVVTSIPCSLPQAGHWTSHSAHTPFFFKMYLISAKGSYREKERKKARERKRERSLPSTEWLQWPGLNQEEARILNSIQVSHVSGGT